MDAEDAHHLTLRMLGAAGRTGLASTLAARVPDSPRTVMGLTFRNLVTRLLRLPFLASFVLGRTLRDDIQIPEYWF